MGPNKPKETLGNPILNIIIGHLYFNFLILIRCINIMIIIVNTMMIPGTTSIKRKYTD